MTNFGIENNQEGRKLLLALLLFSKKVPSFSYIRKLEIGPFPIFIKINISVINFTLIISFEISLTYKFPKNNAYTKYGVP